MSTLTPLNIGILGGGFMAAVHSRAARAAGASLVAIASSTLSSAVRAADNLGVAHAASTSNEVIEASDIVHICTPNSLHASQALAALVAGRHVICEKPLATTVAEARELTSAAEVEGLVGAVPFVYRYHPMVRRARFLVTEGEIGEVLTIDGAYLQDWLLRSDQTNWRATAAAGGASRAFADIGSHLCDLLEFVTGRRIVAVSARTRTVYTERAGASVTNEDIAAILAELDGGVLATLLVSQLAPGRKNSLILEVHGSAKSLRFEQERPEELWIGAESGSQLASRGPGAPGDRGLSILAAGHPMGYQDAFNAFVEDVYAAVRGGTPEGMPTFADGLRAAVVTDAVLESARTGRWIDVA